MAKVRVKLEGAESLRRNGDVFFRAMANENRSVLLREADVLKNLMIAKAPKGTRLLSRSIGTRVWKDVEGVTGIVVGVKGGVEEFKVGKGGKAYYPASQEYGWEYPKGVHHPPHPFVRPAFDARKNAITSNLRRALKAVIEKAGA